MDCPFPAEDPSTTTAASSADRSSSSASSSLQNFNDVDKSIDEMLRRNFGSTAAGDKKVNDDSNTTLTNKEAINVDEEATGADDMMQGAKADWDPGNPDAVSLRARILGGYKHAIAQYGAEAVGAPMIQAMIESGEFPIDESWWSKTPIALGDFSSPSVVVRELVGSSAGVYSEGSSEYSEESDDDDNILDAELLEETEKLTNAEKTSLLNMFGD
jgi:hypothetical protein